MWSSSRPALPSRPCDTAAAPADWDSLLPLLPESVRLLRQVLEDDAALHRLLSHCGGLTLRIPRRFPAEGHLLRALLAAAVYAASDEIHQAFVPGRGPAVTDVLLDSAGALCGILIVCLIVRAVCRRKKQPLQ